MDHTPTCSVSEHLPESLSGSPTLKLVLDSSFGRRDATAPLSSARIPHLPLTEPGHTLVEEAGLSQ